MRHRAYEEIDALKARIEADGELILLLNREVARLTEHSQKLNQVHYKIAVHLRKVTPPADYYGDVEADLAQLLTETERREKIHKKDIDMLLDTIDDLRDRLNELDGGG